jgi:hypothetical protein
LEAKPDEPSEEVEEKEIEVKHKTIRFVSKLDAGDEEETDKPVDKPADKAEDKVKAAEKKGEEKKKPPEPVRVVISNYDTKEVSRQVEVGKGAVIADTAEDKLDKKLAKKKGKLNIKISKQQLAEFMAEATKKK